MGKKSKTKGGAFERLTARLIIKAFGVTSKDCYRTPLSGGHPNADPGDLVMSPALCARFPYSVECKHTKDWTLHHIMPLRANVISWVKQTLRASAKNGLRPLLVMRGNCTDIYAMVEITHWRWQPVIVDTTQHSRLKVACDSPAVMVLPCEGTMWVVCRFADFLKISVEEKNV